MELEVSPIQEEIDKIIEDGPKKVHHAWEVEFSIREDCDVKLSEDPDDIGYVPEKEKEKIYIPLKILNIDFVQDFERGQGDEITLTCTIALGQWVKVLYPCRDFLKATLIKRFLVEGELSYDKDEDKETETFACMPKITEANSSEGKHLSRRSRRELDMKGMIDIEFQLTDFSMEKLRLVTFGGIWRRCKPEELLKTILANESKKVSTGDGKAIDYIDVKKVSNETPREQYVIPQDTPLTSVAHYLQVRCGGLYSAGVNQYMRNKTWYVYPLYDTTRFGKESKTLTLIRVPEMTYTNMDRTFRVDGDKVYALATSNADFNDDVEPRYMRDGNGVRFSDARLFMNENLVETRDNKAIAHRKRINHEFVSVDKPKRQFVQQSPLRSHANPFEEYSALARRDGVVYMFEWEKSDPSLIFPGMMAKILYSKGDDIGQLEGSILKVHTATQMLGQAVTAHGHKTTSTLFVFCRYIEDQESNE